MKQLIKVLKIIIPVAIGVYLTWYFFSGLSEEEIIQVKSSFLNANYFWVVVALVVAFLSHLSRARRWLYLVEPMGYKPKLSNVFHSIMAGYVINYTIPRSGEFARAGLMSTYEDIPFEKGIATIVIERLIDVLMLGLVILVTGVLQTDTEAFNRIMEPQEGGSSNFLLWILVIGILVWVGGLIAYFRNKRFKNFIHQKIQGLWEGLNSFRKMEQRGAFIGHTFFIWGCYISGMWLFAQAFPETSNMPIGAVFGAFVVGAAAIALLPGGLGAYPLWVNSVLALYGIHYAGYGIFMWVATTVLMVVLGLSSLYLIQREKPIGIPVKQGQ